MPPGMGVGVGPPALLLPETPPQPMSNSESVMNARVHVNLVVMSLALKCFGVRCGVEKRLLALDESCFDQRSSAPICGKKRFPCDLCVLSGESLGSGILPPNSFRSWDAGG